MTTASEPTGTLEVAMAHASRLLVVRLALAGEQAARTLNAGPGIAGA